MAETQSEKSKLSKKITELESLNAKLSMGYEEGLKNQHHSYESKAAVKLSESEEIRRQL